MAQFNSCCISLKIQLIAHSFFVINYVLFLLWSKILISLAFRLNAVFISDHSIYVGAHQKLSWRFYIYSNLSAKFCPFTIFSKIFPDSYNFWFYSVSSYVYFLSMVWNIVFLRLQVERCFSLRPLHLVLLILYWKFLYKFYFYCNHYIRFVWLCKVLLKNDYFGIIKERVKLHF